MQRLTPYHRARLAGCALSAWCTATPVTLLNFAWDVRKLPDPWYMKPVIVLCAIFGLLKSSPKVVAETTQTLWSDYEKGAL